MASKNLTHNTGVSAQQVKLIKKPNDATAVKVTQIHVPENRFVSISDPIQEKSPEESVAKMSEKSIGLSFHIRPIQKEVVLIDQALLLRAEKFLMNESIIFDPIAKKMLHMMLRRLHRNIPETKKVVAEIASLGAYQCIDAQIEKQMINTRIDEMGNRECSLIESLAFLIQWEPKQGECACIHMDPLIDEVSQFFPLIFIKEKIHPPDKPMQWLTRIDVAYAYPWGKWARGVQWVSVKK